jgi:hypothetical protein
MQPVQFSIVGIEVGEISVASDMVPMDMGGDGDDWFIGKAHHFIVNIADAQSCIDEQAGNRAIQKVTMCFFPVSVFTDYVCIGVTFGSQATE